MLLVPLRSAMAASLHSNPVRCAVAIRSAMRTELSPEGGASRGSPAALLVDGSASDDLRGAVDGQTRDRVAAVTAETTVRSSVSAREHRLAFWRRTGCAGPPVPQSSKMRSGPALRLLIARSSEWRDGGCRLRPVGDRPAPMPPRPLCSGFRSRKLFLRIEPSCYRC
jgi:hypothetical protein